MRAKRRIVGLSILLAASALFWIVHKTIDASLGNSIRFSGWILFLTMIFLATYNLRKKFSVPPLGSSKFWLQCHLYIGLGTGLIFLAHAGATLPSGIIESSLFLLYILVFLSGVLGLLITRVFPSRMTSRGQELIFERFAQVLRDIRIKVETLVEQSVNESGASTIANYYTERLHDFFSGPRHLLRHVFNLNPPLNRRLSEIQDQYRYLNEAEQEMLGEIARCVEAKDALDYQYAMQFALKGWLFIHIPLTYALMVFAIAHLTLVYAFSGNVG